MADKRLDPKWLDQNTYIDKRSKDKKRTLNKAGRVDLAHDEGLESTQSHIVQLPTPDNGEYAVVQVSVATKRGVFTQTGAAKPSDAQGKPLLQMAEARALNRALDIALNYGRHEANPEIVAMDEDDAYLDDETEDLIIKVSETMGCPREIVEEELRKRIGVVPGTILATLDEAKQAQVRTTLTGWLQKLQGAA